MKIKKAQYSLMILLIFIWFGIAFGQKLNPVGNITLEVNSKFDSGEKYFFDVPVNERITILRGDGIRIEQSGTGNVWQLSSSAKADKNNAKQAILKLTLMISETGRKTKIIQKRLKILKGQDKKLQIKYKNFGYYIAAFYKPENK